MDLYYEGVCGWLCIVHLFVALPVIIAHRLVFGYYGHNLDILAILIIIFIAFTRVW